MKTTILAIAVMLSATQANAGTDTSPAIDITWVKEGQTLVRGTHRFVNTSGGLVPFMATSQQQFPYSTCTLEGNTPGYQAKQLAVGRMLLLKPQRTSRGTIHLDIQAEDTEVRTVKSTDHGACTSFAPVIGGLPLTTLSVELPESGPLTVSFPDGQYSLTLRVGGDPM
ncbi:type II and III secretion system protein [Burkholderia sp. Nafp2/4-1b]|uniref:type II and III secretion system protein n=1 Tax=Burkholderia sp. Nafp2/4-1b TaxID=2116686 RepID=UPI0013CE966C|nr:type II and III secretion system protein [Burkholderia sp. Nafp2/4-1b]